MKGRLVTVLLIASMALSLGGCAAVGSTADDEVREFTAEVCENIIDGDYDFFEDNSVLDEEKDRDVDDNLDVFYDNYMWSATQKDISDYIVSTLEYDIDYNSAYASHARKAGEIDVYFTYVDYLRLYKSGQAHDIDEYYSMLKKYDQTCEKKVHITFTMNRRHWLLADYEKIFIDLFTWKDFHFDFSPDYSTKITGTEWEHWGDGVGSTYTNSYYMQLSIYTSDSANFAKDTYYQVYFKDKMIFEGDIYDGGMGYCYAVLYSDLTNDYDYFEEGDYTFIVYDFNDQVLLTEVAHVERDTSSSGYSTGIGSSYYGSHEFSYYISSCGFYDLTDSFVDFDIWYDYIPSKYKIYFCLYDTNGDLKYTSNVLTVSTSSQYIELCANLDDTEFDTMYDLSKIEVYGDNGELVLSYTI